MTEPERLDAQEKKSLTHGEFWIPERERRVYREALEALNGAAIPYVVSGLYAIHHYTGVYRETKDLDLLLVPDQVVTAAETLRTVDFDVSLKEDHWLAQAFRDGAQVDLIFGMANGLAFIDDAWYRNSRPAILAAAPVRVAPPEDLIWHRLFIGERHRFDMADVAHLILHRGPELDWDRLTARVGADWRLLLSQIHFFDFAYPGHRDRVPGPVRTGMRERERTEGASAERTAGAVAERTAGATARSTDGGPAESAGAAGEAGEVGEAGEAGAPLARGTLLSRFSFAIDVNEWGFRDERLRRVAEQRASAEVEAIRNAEVWDA
jgi:hypothetical protein